jgi:hypothetical protein
LERARTLLARQDDGSDEPVIGTMHLPDPVGMVTGWCLVDLGRPREASEELDRQLALVGEDAVRTKVRYGVRRALAYAGAGEIDHACALAAPCSRAWRQCGQRPSRTICGVSLGSLPAIRINLPYVSSGRGSGRYRARPLSEGDITMQGVFINYRTGDGEKTAALIDQELPRRFGPQHIFRASRSIAPGEVYPGSLLAALRRSSSCWPS